MNDHRQTIERFQVHPAASRTSGRPGGKRAVNELTITGYNPVSKQPHFKFSAARIRRIGGG